MQKFDFDDHEYTPIRDGEERARIRRAQGIKGEWEIQTWPKNKLVLQSYTHDDDVCLEISGNFSPEQRLKVITEIRDQLNAAERAFETEETVTPALKHFNCRDTAVKMQSSQFQVVVIESERGWGQKVDSVHYFDSFDEAKAFQIDYNKDNADGPAPDWYMQAGSPQPVPSKNR